jgi:hypothetical protein
VAKFSLLPCSLREFWLCPLKGSEPVSFSWSELARKFAPSGEIAALRTLRALKTGAFVGLLAHPRQPILYNFLLLNTDRSGDLTKILRQDPSFSSRLREVFRVEWAEWDSRIAESPTITSKKFV